MGNARKMEREIEMGKYAGRPFLSFASIPDLRLILFFWRRERNSRISLFLSLSFTHFIIIWLL